MGDGRLGRKEPVVYFLDAGAEMELNYVPEVHGGVDEALAAMLERIRSLYGLEHPVSLPGFGEDGVRDGEWVRLVFTTEHRLRVGVEVDLRTPENRVLRLAVTGMEVVK